MALAAGLHHNNSHIPSGYWPKEDGMQLAPIRESLEEACQAHQNTLATSSDLT